jgi:hypothetical protein
MAMMNNHAGTSAHHARFAGAALALLLAAALATPAFAQDGPGMRAGLSQNPNQFFVGVHYVTQPIIGMLHIQPNVEGGFGNSLTTVAINGEAAIWVKLSPTWHLYAGGGPSINVYRYTEKDKTETHPGLNGVIGIRRKGGLFLEAKVGALDSPSFKIAIGYTIR